MKIQMKREDLLHRLEAVSPGLATRENIEQSNCFIFRRGCVYTYNEEIAASHRLPNLEKDYEGAVFATPLLGYLRKLKEELIEVEFNKEEVVLYGKRKKIPIKAEAQIQLDLSVVDRPSEWKLLHKDFMDGIQSVSECVGRNPAEFEFNCIHIHPRFVEASDGQQLARYRLRTGVTAEQLVRKDSIKHIVALGFTKFAETESWLHFRARSGLVISIRRHLEETQDLTPIIKNGTGITTSFPKGLSQLAIEAEISADDNTDDSRILLELKTGKVRLSAEGTNSSYVAFRNLPYKGKPFSFYISPKLLQELTKKYSECELLENRIRVNGGRFTYVARLRKVEK